MRNYVLTNATWIPGPIIPPDDCVEKCYSIDYLRRFIENPRSQGVKIRIVRTRTSFQRICSIYRGDALGLNEFVIGRDVIETKFTGYNSLELYIYVDSSGLINLIIERSYDICEEDGPGGDGVKVKIPTE